MRVVLMREHEIFFDLTVVFEDRREIVKTSHTRILTHIQNIA